LITAFIVAAVLAAVAGVRTAPGSELADPRRSTYLTGPAGTSGLARTIQELGVVVEPRRRSLFDLTGDSGITAPVVALLDVETLPTRVEQAELVEYVKHGGSLVLAGLNGVERCFGTAVDMLRDSAAIPATDSFVLPWAHAVINVSQESERELDTGLEGVVPCTAPAPVNVDTLMLTVAGGVVAWRLDFAGGGNVLMLADSRFLSNEMLKKTDAGILIIPWLLELGGAMIVVDEYHQGFGDGGSLLVAAWRWTLASPSGWALLQLVLAGLLALGIGAIRFGPTVTIVERHRRSTLEHLDALAAGLQRAGGHAAAVGLIVGGLRRRLAVSGLVRWPTDTGLQEWLGSLELAARTPAARSSVERLKLHLEDRGHSDRVLKIATTVEDVWEALIPATKYEKS
jgi:hypothetical protein